MSYSLGNVAYAQNKAKRRDFQLIVRPCNGANSGNQR